jgi:hypothetical protein
MHQSQILFEFTLFYAGELSSRLHTKRADSFGSSNAQEHGFKNAEGVVHVVNA